MSGCLSRGALLLAFLASSSSYGAPDRLVAIPWANPWEISALVAHKISIQQREGDMLLLRVGPGDEEALRRLGYAPTLILEDADRFHDSDGKFHTPDELAAEMNQLAQAYPQICRLSVLGITVEGREIWTMRVSDNPDLDEDEPEVRVVGSHHGDERMSVEVPLAVMRHLLENYGTDPEATYLVDERDTWFTPLVNPDGAARNRRTNANGVDLNRNYGYHYNFSEGGSSTGPYSQPEVRAMRDQARDRNFSVSLSYHTSGDIINYVWNYNPIRTPDEALIYSLSERFQAFTGYEITFGWDWYQTNGDTNDFSYGTRGDIDTTMEISDYNEETVIAKNLPAVLDLMDMADTGIRGIVTDEDTGEPLEAVIWVEENNWPVFTDPAVGDFHRLLLPGTYTVRAWADGHAEVTVSNVVVTDGPATEIDLALPVGGGFYALNVTTVVNAHARNYDNITHAHMALGPPDGIPFSIGEGGDVVFELGSPLDDHDGPDLAIHAGPGGAAESCEVYLGTTMDGPWRLLGQATGSTQLEASGAGLVAPRFVRLVDLNNGPITDAYSGFDLDALENLTIQTIPPGPYLTVADLSPHVDLTPGDMVRLKITVLNRGTEGVSKTNLVVTSAHPGLRVLSGNLPLGDIPPGQMATSSWPHLLLQADADLTDGEILPLNVEWNADGASGTTQTTLRVSNPLMALSSIEVDDSTGGNGNGVAEAGETVTLIPTLENQGSAMASMVWAEAVSASPCLVIAADRAEWPKIRPGAARPSLTHLQAHIPVICSGGQTVDLALKVRYGREEHQQVVSGVVGLGR